MNDKNEQSLLTCLEACDTIALYSEISDINWILANAGELQKAFMTVLRTDISEVPDYAVEPLLRVKSDILRYFGKNKYEDHGSSTWPEVLNV